MVFRSWRPAACSPPFRRPHPAGPAGRQRVGWPPAARPAPEPPQPAHLHHRHVRLHCHDGCFVRTEQAARRLDVPARCLRPLGCQPACERVRGTADFGEPGGHRLVRLDGQRAAGLHRGAGRKRSGAGSAGHQPVAGPGKFDPFERGQVCRRPRGVCKRRFDHKLRCNPIGVSKSRIKWITPISRIIPSRPESL